MFFLTARSVLSWCSKSYNCFETVSFFIISGLTVYILTACSISSCSNLFLVCEDEITQSWKVMHSVSLELLWWVSNCTQLDTTHAMLLDSKVFFWKRHREVTRSSVLSFHKRSHIVVINNIWLWTCSCHVQNLWAVKISSYERNIAWKHWISVNGFRSFQGCVWVWR